jgi:uncharacterized protein YukE
MADQYAVDLQALKSLATDFHSRSKDLISMPSAVPSLDFGDDRLRRLLLLVIGDIERAASIVAEEVDQFGTNLDKTAEAYEGVDGMAKSALDKIWPTPAPQPQCTIPTSPAAIPGPAPVAGPTPSTSPR